MADNKKPFVNLTIPNERYEEMERKVKEAASAPSEEEKNFEDIQDLAYSSASRMTSPENPYGGSGAPGLGPVMGGEQLNNIGEVVMSDAEKFQRAAATNPSAPQIDPLSQVVTDDTQELTLDDFEPQAAEAPGVDMSGLEGSVSDYQRALKDSDKVISEAESAKNEAIDTAQKQLDESRREHQSWLSKRQEEHLELKGKIQEQASSKIDPDNYWKDMSGNTDVGKKVTAAIAIALGGFGAGLQGGGARNTALDIIDKAIDRDIAAQKANMDNQRAGLKTEADFQDTYYSRGMQAYKDEESAILSAKIMSTEKTINQVEAMRNKLGNKEAGVKMQAMITDLRMKQAAQEQKLMATASSAKVISQISEAIDKGQNIPIEVMAQLPPNVQQMVKYEKQVTIPGIGKARSPEAASKVSEMVGGIKEIEQNMLRIMEIKRKYPVAQKFPGSVRTTLEAIGKRNIIAYKSMGAMGALDVGVITIGKSAIGDPTAYWDRFEWENELAELKKSNREKIAPYMQTMKHQEPALKGLPGFKRHEK